MRSLTSLRGESASVPPTATGLSRYGDEPEEEEEEEEEELFVFIGYCRGTQSARC